MPKSRGRPKRKTTARQDQGSPFAQLVSMVGEAVQAGAPPAAFREVGAELAQAGLTEAVIELFFAEAVSRSPSSQLLDGCAALLTVALDAMRLAANGGHPNARAALRQAGEALEHALASANVDPATLMSIVRAFALANLPPPEALRAAMTGAVDALRKDSLSPPPEAHFADLAKGLGHDPFAIHADAAASGAAFSAEQRFALAAGMALSHEPAIRAAAIGFLLDADEEVGNALARFLADEGAREPCESILVERIARLRPWLAPQRQGFVDDALAALRKTALAPVAPPARTVLRWLATLCDGAGAQSLIATVKIGRKFALAAVLIKDGVGVADAWATPERSKRDIDDMLTRMASEIDARTVTRAYVERRLADALALNTTRSPPPYGLVQALETTGLGPIAPQRTAPAALVEELLSDVANAPHETARGLDDWGQAIAVFDSWFEADEHVDALLAPHKTTDARITAMLDDHLAARREAWMARLAWTAAALKGSTLDGLWIELASAAQALAGERPVANSPLMRAIAERSVEAYEARA